MEKRRREDCFFGVHFDFHASDDCVNIGENTTPKQLQYMLDTIQPEFVQCDCKGHPGIASYESAVGEHAPGFVQDNLKLWRDVTAEAGVPLFLHYSGVFDMAAVKAHPEWAIVDAEGKISENYTSLKGGYSDGLLIPQLLEVIGRYDVDGVWIDGEAWAVFPDYSEAFLEAFRRDTGCETVPKKPEDPDYEMYMGYLRESFRQYLRHCTDELHRRYPKFQIASNWAFSTYMPEPVSVGVDYLSADYNPLDSYNTARFESRYLATQGKPWDIMGWSFVTGPEDGAISTKSACQIEREAAAPLSLGGGFQVYVQQNRDGSLEEWMLPVVGEVSRFCQERRDWCFRAENVPQVAVLLSTYNYYKTAKRALFPDKEHYATRGITQALLDSQLSVQLISEHHLKEDLMKYPVILLPETVWLEEETVAMLRSYMERGGHLIAVGPFAARYFAQETLTKIPEQPPVNEVRYLDYNDWLTGLHSLSYAVTPDPDTEVIGRLYQGNAAKGPSSPAATCHSVGKGSCTCVWINIGERYLLAQRSPVRDFLGALVRKVFQPMVRVTGSHLVDVNISRKEEKLLVHLINTSGNHGSEHTYIYDEITPLRDLHIEVDCPVSPENVELIPQGHAEWKWEKGVLCLTLEQFDIYTVIAIW